MENPNKIKKLKNPIFIDSGAHGLYNVYVKGASQLSGNYDFFKTQEFTDYLSAYADFIKENEEHLEVYANVDAIFNAEVTWEIQQRLENEYGIKPIPVIHYGTDLKWLRKYLEAGHKYIALGGPGQHAGVSSYIPWADAAFNVICDQKSRLPKVKVHGFAVTSLKLMRRYPWYSVDSSSWRKIGAYGNIIIPPFINGDWSYTKQATIVKCSLTPTASNEPNLNHDLSKHKTSIFKKYIEEKGFKIGKSKLKEVEESYILQENERWLCKKADGKKTNTIETILEKGVVNSDIMRYDINALYYIDAAKSMKKWPWAFIQSSQKSLKL